MEKTEFVLYNKKYKIHKKEFAKEGWKFIISRETMIWWEMRGIDGKILTFDTAEQAESYLNDVTFEKIIIK